MAWCNASVSGNTDVLSLSFEVLETSTKKGSPRALQVNIYAVAHDTYHIGDGIYLACPTFTVSCGSAVPVLSKTFTADLYQGVRTKVFSQIVYFPIEKGKDSISLSSQFRCDARVYSDNYGYSVNVAGVFNSISGVTKEPLNPSTVSINVDTVKMGENLIIKITRVDTACIHKLSYTFGGTTVTMANNVGTSYVWTVPDLAHLCNNATSGECTITCQTYLNSTYLGSTTVMVTLKVQDPTTVGIAGEEITLGQNSTITCKRNSANFTVRLEFIFYGITDTITEDKVNSHTWRPGYDLAKRIPNLTYATGTLKCTTLNGSALVGSKTATVRVIVPENDVTRPVFSLDGLVLSPINYLDPEFDGLYMRGKTGMTAEFTATSEYSTIKGYSILVGGAEAEGNPAVIDLLVNEGDVKVIARATDARGFTSTVETTVYILPYRKPKVIPYTGYSAVICERALASGELSLKGSYLAVKAGKSYSSVVLNGEEKNDCALKYRWKTTAADDYGEWITLLAEGSEEMEVSLLISNVVSSLSTSYDVQIMAEDTLGGKHKLDFVIMTESVSFVLYDGVDGAGFGKFPEEEHVIDVASHMIMRVRGKLEVLGNEWIGLGFASGVIESVYDCGRKEDSGCHYLVSEGCHVYAAFNAGFRYAGSAVVINGTAIAEADRPGRTVYSLCPVNDRAIAMVSIGTDGYIRVEWVQALTQTVLTGEWEVTWIDGYLDYWI